VRRSLEQSAEVRFKEPKTRRSRRTVVMPRFVREALRKHRLAQLNDSWRWDSGGRLRRL